MEPKFWNLCCRVAQDAAASVSGVCTLHGRQMSALWLWQADPATPPRVSPISRWSKEVRLANTHPRREAGTQKQLLRVLRLPVLRRTWERGLVGAALLSPPRLHCAWKAPFRLVDDRGTEFSHHHVASITQNNVNLCHAPLQPKEGGGRRESIVGKNAASRKLARRQADNERSIIAAERSSQRSVDQMNASRAQGYLIESGECEMCGQAKDTLHHQSWSAHRPSGYSASQIRVQCPRTTSHERSSKQAVAHESHRHWHFRNCCHGQMETTELSTRQSRIKHTGNAEKASCRPATEAAPKSCPVR